MTQRFSALVIGNSNYDNATALKNPVNDAADIAAKLEQGGFAVTKRLDASNKDMDRALKEFKQSLSDKEVGLFFFAGHGMQIDGDNYLAAVDTEIEDETDAKHSSLSLNRVIESMEKAGTPTNIIILDACRNNPWEQRWARSAITRGLAPVYAPRGTLIAFATSPGQVASDGKGRNGAYTAALLDHIDTADCSIETMFKRVRNTLSAATSQKQISWEHTSLAGEFYFNLGIGARITEYSATALSDRLFVLDDSKGSHVLIRALKSYNWYTQNPELNSFTVKKAARASTDSLFVVGRNIYQAACGNADSAIKYVSQFMDRTTGLEDDKRKALLDGMLFEIFFDADGKPREEPKARFFSDLFDLQQFTELKRSFEFIANCLGPHASMFHAIPGKGHVVAVDVKIGEAPNNEVECVYANGSDILWLEDEDYAGDEERSYRTYDRGDLESRIAEQMFVPARLLKFTYSRPAKSLKKLKFPRGYTTRKRTSD